MKDNQYHGTFILYAFEDPFLRKKSAKDVRSKFFKFISPTISTCSSTWVQHVLQNMLNSISTRTLEDLLHGNKPMKYESMMYVYTWMMEEHQPFGIDYQLIRDGYIEDSMTQHYIEFNEDHRSESRF